MKAYSTFTNFTRGFFPLIILSLLAGLTACRRKVPEQDTGQAAAQADETVGSFPVTLKHVFGETTIPAQPKRIVSLSSGRADTLWALGVKPIAVRYWYGDYEYAAWPWAQEALGDSKPFVIKGELDFEKIAELQPDLILAVYSGLKKEEYDLLSKIAPVVVRGYDKNGKEYKPYGTPWDVMTLVEGRAVGKYNQAQKAVADINARIKKIANAHPHWKGKESTWAYYGKSGLVAYTDVDVTVSLVNQFGFVTNSQVVKAQKESKSKSYNVSLSQEHISKLESDVLFWLNSSLKGLEQLKNLEGRNLLKTHKEGREVYIDGIMSGALGHVTILSIPYALDNLVPLIEAAIDGNPETVVESTKKAGLLD